MPLDPRDPRNRPGKAPGGGRLRVRLNRVGREVVAYVVQYETPVDAFDRSQAPVIRPDGTHRPHFDRYDVFGNEKRDWWGEDLAKGEAATKAIKMMQRNWRRYRRDYFEGLG